jgi:hypothetical protein
MKVIIMDRLFGTWLRKIFLIQHVREPTRENNVLDLVLSSNDRMVNTVDVKEHPDNSDHNTVCWDLICNIKQVVAEKRSQVVLQAQL